jgi:serine/threonine protein kinase
MLEMIGDYNILEKIGQGGFSRVYRASGILDGKDYCAKITNLERNPHKKFLVEDTILEECTKKNVYGVVKIFAKYEDEKNHITILEYMSNSQDLFYYKDRINYKDFIANELISIVKELHKNSIYHIDIKPDNVIVSPERIMLIDFDAAIRE